MQELDCCDKSHGILFTDLMGKALPGCKMEPAPHGTILALTL